MRISDWSSDVCSSDLQMLPHQMTPIGQQTRGSIRLQKPGVLQRGDLRLEALQLGILASCVGAQIVGAEVVGQAAALGQLLDGAARAERPAVVVVQGGVAVRDRKSVV